MKTLDLKVCTRDGASGGEEAPRTEHIASGVSLDLFRPEMRAVASDLIQLLDDHEALLRECGADPNADAPLLPRLFDAALMRSSLHAVYRLLVGYRNLISWSFDLAAIEQAAVRDEKRASHGDALRFGLWVSDKRDRFEGIRNDLAAAGVNVRVASQPTLRVTEAALKDCRPEMRAAWRELLQLETDMASLCWACGVDPDDERMDLVVPNEQIERTSADSPLLALYMLLGRYRALSTASLHRNVVELMAVSQDLTAAPDEVQDFEAWVVLQRLAFERLRCRLQAAL